MESAPSGTDRSDALNEDPEENGELRLRPGAPMPLGAVARGDGVHFALYSSRATQVWIALFRGVRDKTPDCEIALDPAAHRMGHVWCVHVEGLRPGALYCYRADGPHDPRHGHRFDPHCYLVDPYARIVVDNREGGLPKCQVPHDAPVSDGASRPRVAPEDAIIYETHVKGLTAHPSSEAAEPGTYRAVAEMADYFKDLGVTTIELLPVQECGEPVLKRQNPLTGEHLTNYWGYSPLNFFAPAGRFASQGGEGEQWSEFRAMVDALHRKGLEVVLDVVYNHTSEGGAGGPVQSFRGIDNALYYLLDSKGAYLNYTGCGNTVKCAHPVVGELIVESLRCWARHLRVDGFRFDLASVMNRGKDGHLQQNSPLVERIAEDPVLQGVKLIAEAWDVGGAYQVGAFGTPRWADWNGRFRDDVRRFWRGDMGSKADFALRLTGSPELYQPHDRAPQNSINFVTAHDGFTLRDLVSYNEKHNEANGENNNDGSDHNISWNCGVEGDTDDPEVNELRARMQKDFLATLFLALGTPMLLGGDEFGRTQEGNNNAYCQDNPTSWCDWGLMDRYSEIHRFTKAMIRFRREHPVLRRTEYFTGAPCGVNGEPDLAWFDPWGAPLAWEDPELCLACMVDPSQNDGVGLYMMFNPTLVAREFFLPPQPWRLRINTARPSPNDIVSAEDAPAVSSENRFVVGRKALAVLTASGEEGA